MFGIPLIFAAPAVLVALVGLGALYLLLRVTPPAPRRTVFPPLRLLIGLASNETEPARTPWAILLLRMAVATLIILAMAQPLWNSLAGLAGSGPLLVLIDDGWAGAPTFEKRVAFARQRMEAAARAGRIVAVKPLSEGARDIAPLDAAGIEGRLRALAPAPYEPSRADSMPAIEQFLAREPKTDVLWIADGVELGGASGFAARLASLSRSVEVVTDGTGARAIAGIENEAGALAVRLVRSEERAPARGLVRALDARGREIARAAFDFGSKLVTTSRFELPVELRNETSRVVIEGEPSAGATWLVDDRSRRRRVAIASGASADQPLLSPTYYLKRALEPFADVSESHDSASDPIVSLLAEGPSVLALADMSVAPGPEHDAIVSFLDKGGVLLRFAGSRLAAGDDDLIPCDLRRGGRQLGGALSWETPKHIAPFAQGSPFFGLAAPEEVTIARQVLAEPTAGLDQKTWARLADGTPLVTAARRGKGLIVLFHVTGDTTWSNLPLSGLFVEMLRRVVALSGPSVQAAAKTGAVDRTATFQPWRTLNGFGALGPPPAQAEPISADFAGVGDAIHPPGFYGQAESPRAVNALSPAQSIVRADYGALKVREGGLDVTPPIDLRLFLLPAALIGLAIDAFVSMWIAGSAGLRRRGALVAVAFAAMFFGALFAPSVNHAAEISGPSARDMDAALSTRLAYVATGDATVDETSREGLIALTRVLAARTSAELAEPIALDPARDELAFYPLIYWPIVAGRPQPRPEARARLAAYMKYGGTVVFDTRDALTQRPGGAPTEEALWLRALLEGVDVPELEPLPPDHVLTKTFYLLDRIVGRTEIGQTWVEALPPPDPNDRVHRPVRAGDGVSPLIIASDDLAAAWASDAEGRPLFPLIPGGTRQRELALRSGVNLVMYTLTGNYKADQVHAKDIIERLTR